MLAEWATDRGLCTGGAALSGGAGPHAATARGQAWHGRTGPRPGRSGKGRHWLPAWPVSPPPPEGFNYRRVANLYQALGGRDSRAIFTDHEPRWRLQPASQQTALFWRDAAASALPHDVEGAWCGAGSQGLVAAGLAREGSGGRTDQLARSQDGEGGWHPACRSDLDRHYRQSQTTSPSTAITGAPAVPGYSIAGADPDGATGLRRWPVAPPSAASELVDMDAGDLPDSPLPGAVRYLCSPGTVAGTRTSRARGTTLAAAGSRGLGVRSGTPAPGFEVVDWVGGATLTGDWHELGWGLTLSRRPVSSSLLSHGDGGSGHGHQLGRGAGERDPPPDLSHDLGGRRVLGQRPSGTC